MSSRTWEGELVAAFYALHDILALCMDLGDLNGVDLLGDDLRYPRVLS